MKKIGGFFFEQKSYNAEKKLKRGPFSVARYCIIVEKRKNFLVQFPGPTGILKFCTNFGGTIMVTSGV